MDNKQKSINKMDLLLRGMAKVKGIDPDSKMNDWNEKERKAVAEMQRQPVDWEAIDKYVKMAGGTICRAGKKFKKENQLKK